MRQFALEQSREDRTTGGIGIDSVALGLVRRHQFRYRYTYLSIPLLRLHERSRWLRKFWLAQNESTIAGPSIAYVARIELAVATPTATRKHRLRPWHALGAADGKDRAEAL
jgi:hypothetical protein